MFSMEHVAKEFMLINFTNGKSSRNFVRLFLSLSLSLSKDRRNIETFNLNLQSAKWTRSNVRFDSKQVQNIVVSKYICTLN